MGICDKSDIATVRMNVRVRRDEEEVEDGWLAWEIDASGATIEPRTVNSWYGKDLANLYI